MIYIIAFLFALLLVVYVGYIYFDAKEKMEKDAPIKPTKNKKSKTHTDQSDCKIKG